jgi:hypothetical protein
MTATRELVCDTTPKSCVISSTAVPISAARPSSRSRICFCTVASSAVVGSSAMRSFGPDRPASAIITRWRIPPESSCG